jgi:hypothetical protein
VRQEVCNQFFITLITALGLDFGQVQIPRRQDFKQGQGIRAFLDVPTFHPGTQDFPLPLLRRRLIRADGLPVALAVLISSQPFQTGVNQHALAGATITVNDGYPLFSFRKIE